MTECDQIQMWAKLVAEDCSTVDENVEDSTEDMMKLGEAIAKSATACKSGEEQLANGLMRMTMMASLSSLTMMIVSTSKMSLHTALHTITTELTP